MQQRTKHCQPDLNEEVYLPKHALSDLVGTDPLRIETAINIGTTK